LRFKESDEYSSILETFAPLFPQRDSLVFWIPVHEIRTHAFACDIIRPPAAGMTFPLLMFSSAREIDSAYFFFLPTSEKYGNKTRRAKCPTRKLSEFTSVNEFFLVNDASQPEA